MEGRIKHAVLEALNNGNVTDQLSAGRPGVTMGGNIDEYRKLDVLEVELRARPRAAADSRDNDLRSIDNR